MASITPGDDNDTIVPSVTPHTADDPGTAFLLSEIETARAFMSYDITAGEKRTDLLLTIASGASAGFVILSQTHISQRDYLYAMLAVSLGFLVIAIPSYFEVLRLDVSAVKHIRTINLIRKYFEENYGYIKPALLLPSNPQYPKFGRVSGNRRIQMGVIALAGATAIASAVMLVCQQMSFDTFAVIVASAMFLVTVAVLEAIARIRYWVAEYRFVRSGSVWS